MREEVIITMVYRPYTCPLCHSAFRNESGMKWHIAHRHEVPAAFDALGKDYEVKTASLKEENSQLKQELEQLREQLLLVQATLSEEKVEKLDAFNQIQRLEQERDKTIMALVVRDKILKDQFNIELPNPLVQ